MTVTMSSGIISCCCAATAIPPRQITCNGKWRSANCRVSLLMGFASSALPAPRSTSRISLQRLLMSWNCKRGRNHSTRFSSPTERWGVPSTIPLKLCKKEKRDRKGCIGVFFGVRGILRERKYWIFFFRIWAHSVWSLENFVYFALNIFHRNTRAVEYATSSPGAMARRRPKDSGDEVGFSLLRSAYNNDRKMTLFLQVWNWTSGPKRVQLLVNTHRNYLI